MVEVCAVAATSRRKPRPSMRPRFAAAASVEEAVVERRVCPDAAKVRGPGPPISSGLWLLSIAPLYRLATPYGRELIDGRAEAASVQ